MKSGLRAEKAAMEKYRQGYTCSEAILLSLQEEDLIDFSPDVVRAATGFGAGIGLARSLCGCISGAVMAIGVQYGRIDPSRSRKLAWDRCHELVERFRKRFGTTQCATLTDVFTDFASQERIEHCAAIIHFVTREVKDILAVPEDFSKFSDPERDDYFRRREDGIK